MLNGNSAYTNGNDILGADDLSTPPVLRYAIPGMVGGWPR